MSDAKNTTCQRNCWVVSAVAGAVLVLALIKAAAFVVGTAIFIGLLCFGFLGLFLTWAFCSGSGATDTAKPVVPQVAPEAVKIPAPIPAPVPPAPPVDSAPAAAPVSAEAPAPAPAMIMAPAKADTPSKAEAPAKAKAAPRAKAKVDEPAPVKPRASKPKAVPADAPPAVQPALERPAKARASGLDAAMGRTKEASAQQAAPLLLLQPRDGRGDDLKLIVGVGPALEKLLNEVGVWHFDQIASWKARDIAFVDSKMANFKGRITRDEWVKQARTLARGGKV